MRRSGRSVGEWDKSAGLRRCGGIIDDLFDAIGQQSVTVAGTQTIEEIAPVPSSHIRQLREQREQLAAKVEALLEDHPLPTVPASMPTNRTASAGHAGEYPTKSSILKILIGKIIIITRLRKMAEHICIKYTATTSKNSTANLRYSLSPVGTV